MHRGVTVLAVLIAVVGWVSGETVYFPDRAPKLYYTPYQLNGDLSVYLVGKTVDTRFIEDVEFAGLLSSFVGGPVFHSGVNYAPQDFFQKDRANVFFLLDGVSQEMLNSVNLKVLQQNGQMVSIHTEIYPQDGIAQLTTLMTGHGPSVHGITNSTWVSIDGLVRAYSKEDSSPEAPSVADTLLHAFEGQSFLVATGADCQVAAALSVNRFHSASASAFTYCYNSISQQYENLNSNTQSFNHQSLLEGLSARKFVLRSNQDQVVFGTEQVTVKFVEDSVAATFDLKDLNNFLFFSEIEMAYNVLASIKSGKIQAIVQDSTPDMFSFAFTTISKMSAEQQKAAILLLDGVVSELTAEIEAVYGRIATSIMFKGDTAYEMARAKFANSDISEVYNTVGIWVANQANMKSAFPAVYLEYLSPRDTNQACEALEQAGLGEYNGYTAVCVAPKVASSFGSFKAAVTGPLTTALDDDVSTFQILIWFNFMIVVAVFFAVKAIFSMDYTGDSYFRSTVNSKTK